MASTGSSPLSPLSAPVKLHATINATLTAARGRRHIGSMRIRILDEATARRLISPVEAIDRCREAYAQLARGEVEQPDVLTIEVERHQGEVHAKGGHLHGSRWFSIKVATGFYRNPERGLPVTSGAVWVFSAETGLLELMIGDNGSTSNAFSMMSTASVLRPVIW